MNAKVHVDCRCFGFRCVDGRSNRWHGFKRDGGRSLCGSVRFGPQRRVWDENKGRPCARCATIWQAQHPKVAA